MKTDTITYVTDDNSPLTPNASLILTSCGCDAEEAWVRKNFKGLWDDEEGREFGDALLEGLGAAAGGARHDRRRIPRDLRAPPHDEACRAQRARAYRAQLGPP